MTKQQTESIKAVLLVVLILGAGYFIGKSSLTKRAGTPAQVFDQNASKTLVDEISSLNTTILKKRDDVASLRTMLQDRQTKIATLLKDNPNVVPFIMLSDTERKTFPTDVQSLIEQTTSFSGKVYTMVKEDDAGKESYSYLVQNGKTLMPLYGISAPISLSGTQQIQGYTLNGSVIVSPEGSAKLQTTNTGGEKSAGTGTSTPVTKKMLALLTKAPGTLDPFTPTQFSQTLFQGRVSQFYKEQSYNKMTLGGDVFGWITMPAGSYNFVDIGDGGVVDAYITANNINLNNYDIIFIYHHVPQGFGGFSSIGPYPFTVNGVTYTKAVFHITSNGAGETGTYMNAENFGQSGAQLINAQSPVTLVTRVEQGVMHEIGHSLGLLHATAYECGVGVSLGLDCVDIEYGSNFDTMAEPRYAFHMNGYFKQLLGWIGGTEALDISTTGTYTLGAFETIGGGKKVARIKPAGLPATYYLEYRFGAAYDNAIQNTQNLQSNAQGIMVSKIGVNGLYRFLDMRPTLSGVNSEWYDDMRESSLNAGATFNDPRTGVTISQVNAVTATTTPTVNFKVTITPTTCVHNAPMLTPYLTPQTITATAGSSVVIFFNTKNTDYPICAPSNFLLTKIVGAPLTATPYNYSYSGVLPEQIINNGFDVNIPITTPSGSYPVQITSTNTGTGLATSQMFTIVVQ